MMNGAEETAYTKSQWPGWDNRHILVMTESQNGLSLENKYKQMIIHGKSTTGSGGGERK